LVKKTPVYCSTSALLLETNCFSQMHSLSQNFENVKMMKNVVNGLERLNNIMKMKILKLEKEI